MVSSLVQILFFQVSHVTSGELGGFEEAAGEGGHVFLAEVFVACVADEFLKSSDWRKPSVEQISGSAT